MIVTLIIADTLRLANHYNDPTAVYIEDLGINNITTRKGVASDIIKFSLAKDTLDFLQSTFLYLCYETTVQVLLNDKLMFAGYIDKIELDAENMVAFEASSLLKYQQKQFMSPSVDVLCQNQVYSENCKLSANNYAYHFDDVQVDCLAGKVSLEIDEVAGTIALGGSTTIDGDDVADGNVLLLDGNDDLIEVSTKLNNTIFYDRAMWWNAYVVIDGIYRSNVVNVSDTDIFLSMNYLNYIAQARTISVYLKCDKTYGQCFSRFRNTKNFWGFANNGRKLNTYDIFSATSLNYCGDELAETEFEYCSTDFSIFGVNLYE